MTPRATTLAEMMALKAEVEPRKTRPKISTKMVVRRRALRGTCRVGWMVERRVERGRPRSRAKAKVMRLEVVRMEIVAKRRQVSGNLEF